MNHDAPRQLPDGRWHYTRHNRRTGTYPIGYCSDHQACPDCPDSTMGDPDCTTCGGKGVIRAADPCPGHETADEACEHYKQYLLDKRMIVHDDSDDPHQLNRCEAPDCKAMTDGYVQIGRTSRLYTLCREHRTRETVSDIMGKVGEAWSS